MEYHMRVVERGGAEVNKKSFIRWRGNGIAFRVVEDDSNEEDLHHDSDDKDTKNSDEYSNI